MRGCTHSAARTATRKLAAALGRFALLALAGCATPGETHLYTLASPTAAEIRDAGAAGVREVPSFLAPGDRVTGFAYDPFTDHFFLRLAPGNQIRVVDRPARAIKREFTVAELPVSGGGDLAVRPKTGHLYFVHPTEPALIETTRLCAFVRLIPLPDLNAPAAGVAYDATTDGLLVLHATAATASAEISRRTLDGAKIAVVKLARRATGPLAYDAETREFYVGDAAEAGRFAVFDERGAFGREVIAARPASFLDLGPRSFIRVF